LVLINLYIDYTFIYIEREREKERESARYNIYIYNTLRYDHMYTYIYMPAICIH
jgi:predicted glycosyltransferase